MLFRVLRDILKMLEGEGLIPDAGDVMLDIVEKDVAIPCLNRAMELTLGR